MRLFSHIEKARFVSRPNRFIVRCRLAGRTVSAYLPNPGRLWELLLPDAELFLVRVAPSAGRKLVYLVAAVERGGLPVMLHTHHTNLVAERLLRDRRVPGFEHAEVLQREHPVGSSRFDFLLRNEGREMLLEVKSCTLFHRTLAMFPDAVSARASRHLQELDRLARRGVQAGVLFIVHSPWIRWFMPEHHTDLEFCRAMLMVKERVTVKAVSVEWDERLELGQRVRELSIPWDLVERESHDRGSYIVILRLARDRTLPIGALGRVRFRRGFYLYAGSAMQNMTQRLARHQRLTKKKHWHVDHLREHAQFIAAIPVRSSMDRECDIAGALSLVGQWTVPDFGSSDCSCPSHLFGMEGDPFRSREFIERLLYFRMGKLEEELQRRVVSVP